MAEYTAKKIIHNGDTINFQGGGGVSGSLYLADVLVVGSGGTGMNGGSGNANNGGRYGGGGGAGGFLECHKYLISQNSTCVKVGCPQHICRAESQYVGSKDGCPSCFGALFACGGHAGRGGDASEGWVCAMGGSQGDSMTCTGYKGGMGYGTDSCNHGAGGGAGAGGAGCASTGVCVGAAGGPGKLSYITGTTLAPGGAGGINGGSATICGGGGLGVGGEPRKCHGCCSISGGGIVAVRYPTDGSYGFTCAIGGNTCSTCNGYKIHCFTSDGTFTIVS